MTALLLTLSFGTGCERDPTACELLEDRLLSAYADCDVPNAALPSLVCDTCTEAFWACSVECIEAAECHTLAGSGAHYGNVDFWFLDECLYACPRPDPVYD